MKVAIVVMPFLAFDRPSLAAGLLKATVEQRGITCDCKYFNITFSKMVGHHNYLAILESPTTVLAGEWIFSQMFYGQSFSDWASYERDVLNDPIWGLPSQKNEFIRSVLDLAPSFLTVAFESNDWGKYDLVAFTSTFEQTMPSLCLARMIRKHYPRVRIAAGGANFESSMGAAYMEHFDFLDYVCTGEGDACFPQLCENLSKGVEDVPQGLLYRGGDQVPLLQNPNQRLADLDSLPFPAFADYFQVFSMCFPESRLTHVLPIETSRGCWWGERSHCTFCGLNGNGIRFRKKQWRRVVQEVNELTSNFPSSFVQFTDNILSLDYFNDLIPYWVGNHDSTMKFFEVKSNLTREQVEMLSGAGVVSMQPGIENFGDDTLRLMRKGVTGAQNVAILRWSAEVDLDVRWNLIFGFPREPANDYNLNLSVMKLITHLNPPDACTCIRVDRFSPNFAEWQSLGFSAIRPISAYKHILPFDEAELTRFAYYFAYEHSQFDCALSLGKPLEDLANSWRDKSDAGANGSLAILPRIGGGFVLIDTRFNFEKSKQVLDPIALELLLQCDSPIAPRRAIANVTATCESTIEDTYAVLDALISRGAIAVIGKQAITLALIPQEARLLQKAETTQIQSLRSEDQCRKLSIL
jgi:ribosomal peptide maturation radical SAM protein 1